MSSRSQWRVGAWIAAVAAAFLALLAAIQPPTHRRVRASPTAASELARYRLDTAVVRSQLPRALREISGLAMSRDGRLFAHDDERAVIYEIAPRDGRVVKYFTLGSPPVRGDFEGLAVVDSGFFLVTSTGLLYRAREGRHEEGVQYTVQATGLGSVCEIEGLAYEPADRSLLLACKRTQGKALGNAVTIFRWSIDGQRLATPRVLSIPLAHFTDELNRGEFHPSGLERDPKSGHYFLVAARQRAVAEVTPNGAVLAVRRLPGAAHAQPEGIALSPDRTLIVSDEGAGGRATLTLYPYVR